MPPREHEHEATGPGDLIDWRLREIERKGTKLEEEHWAHVKHCEIGKGELWEAVDDKPSRNEIKQELEPMKADIKALLAASVESRLKMIFVFTVISGAWSMIVMFGFWYITKGPK